MRAKLIFNLPEDNFEYLLANSSCGMFTILCNLQQKVRYELKHNDDFFPEVSLFRKTLL
jgi:hypothetical protein